MHDLRSKTSVHQTGRAHSRGLMASILMSCALWSGCATSSLPIDPAFRTALTDVDLRFGVDRVADAALGADVLFLGEEHGNREGHRLQLAVLHALWTRGADVVVSMEMFERDVQGVLDAYLCGRIDEQRFLAESRPWPGYPEQYRLVVEFARVHGMPVIAANVPRALARKVSQEGLDALVHEPHVARSTSAPRDAYWKAFVDAMKGHMGNSGEEPLYRMYQAQCLKDDTMAESILKARAEVPRRIEGPLVVVHLNGKFHSDQRLGTAARVLEREPNLRVLVVSMKSTDVPEQRGLVVDRAIADFTWVVAAEPKRVLPAPRVAPSRAQEVPAEEKQPEVEAETAADTMTIGRPALGIMPDYESGAKGLTIASVLEGGAAADAGLKDGDLVTAIDGQEIEDVRSYMQVMSGLQVGETVPIEVMRDGKSASFKVKVGVRRQ